MITQIDHIKKADIIVIGNAFESQAIRAAIELFGIQTRTHYIGNIRHLIALLENPNYLHNIVIISCHGSEENLLIPHLAPKLEEDMPFHNALTPDDFKRFLNLNNQIVLNTGCGLGKEKMADAFLSKGAKAYIGSVDYIDGSAMSLFIITFLYFSLFKNEPLEIAFDKAKNIDEETKLLKLWHKELMT